MDFVDFKWISWISNGFRGFQMDFVDFKWISGFPVDFSRFLDFRLDFCDVVRDFARVGPLGSGHARLIPALIYGTTTLFDTALWSSTCNHCALPIREATLL